MADLGAIYPDGDGANPGSIEYSTGSTAYSLINTDPDTAPGTSDWIGGLYNSATSEIWMSLGTIPTDFETMDSVQIRVYVLTNGVRSNDDVAMQVAIATADDAETFLAGATSTTPEVVATWDAGGEPTNQVYGIDMTYVNTSAAKSAWDAAWLHFSWTKSKSGGWDTNVIRVAAVEVNGVYTEVTGTNYDETGRSISIAATVAATDDHNIAYDETGRSVSIAATVAATDELSYSEDVTVDATSTVAATDQWDATDATSISIDATVAGTDTADFTDAVSVSVDATVAATDDRTLTAENVSVAILGTVDATDAVGRLLLEAELEQMSEATIRVRGLIRVVAD